MIVRLVDIGGIVDQHYLIFFHKQTIYFQLSNNLLIPMVKQFIIQNTLNKIIKPTNKPLFVISECISKVVIVNNELLLKFSLLYNAFNVSIYTIGLGTSFYNSLVLLHTNTLIE